MRNIKKIFAVALALVVAMSCMTLLASAEETSVENTVCKIKLDTDIAIEDPLKDFVPESMDFLAEQMVTRSVTYSVAVTEPCDQYWQDTYPDNWMWQAHRCVVNADTMLTNNYGIQYYSVSQKYWTSNNTTAEDLVAEARSEWGLRDGADLMVAFTGRDGGNTMGIVDEIGEPYALIFDNGYEYNRETVQHETGHCYGLIHCYGDNCVMTAYGMGHIDTICSTHDDDWTDARSKY